MFTRVRASLLLWNLLIISVMLLVAGSVTYISQRQSSLAAADRVLTQSNGTLPTPVVSGGQSPAWYVQQAPDTLVDSSGHVRFWAPGSITFDPTFTLVVDSSGHVLADPEKLGVTDISLPTMSGVTIGGRFNILWDNGIRIQTVRRAQKLFYFQTTSNGAVQEGAVVRSVLPEQNADYLQTITTGTIQGWPVRLLVRPVIFQSSASSQATGGVPVLPPASGEDLSPDAFLVTGVSPVSMNLAHLNNKTRPDAFLVTGVSLVPMEQSLHQTLVFLLIGGAAGLLLSLLGSWFLAGRALVPIQQAFRRQQEFVADAAHELRTPLTILQTSTHLLNQHRSEPLEAQGRVFDDLHEEIGRLTRLTCDLLDLARSDLGQLDLALGRVDLEQMSQTLVRRLSAVAAERAIDLRLEGSGRPSIVDADSDRLQQALLVLLDNALKHTPPGGAVTLAVSESGRSAVIEVRDTGEGISPEALGRIFDRFYRGDAARSRSTGGAGLGLAIARTLVEAHGGSLTLSNALGSGTVATIRLPLTASAFAVGRWPRAKRRFFQISNLF